MTNSVVQFDLFIHWCRNDTLKIMHSSTPPHIVNSYPYSMDLFTKKTKSFSTVKIMLSLNRVISSSQREDDMARQINGHGRWYRGGDVKVLTSEGFNILSSVIEYE